MQGDQQFFRQKGVLPLPDQVGNSYVHTPLAPAFGALLNSSAKYSTSCHAVEFQPSEVCPKNFIIFDQTDHRNQIMFHPWISNKCSAPGTSATCIEMKEVDRMEKEISLPLKEDSDDIDALLSLEEDGQEYDDEEVSTARTSGDHRSSSPDSFSSYCSKPKKNRFSSSSQKSSSSSDSCNNERKRQKMKKMVRALKGIVPGGNQMHTAAVLDEAVRYLKSLKVEVQKLGVGDSDDV